MVLRLADYGWASGRAARPHVRTNRVSSMRRNDGRVRHRHGGLLTFWDRNVHATRPPTLGSKIGAGVVAPKLEPRQRSIRMGASLTLRETGTVSPLLDSTRWRLGVIKTRRLQCAEKTR